MKVEREVTRSFDLFMTSLRDDKLERHRAITFTTCLLEVSIGGCLRELKVMGKGKFSGAGDNECLEKRKFVGILSAVCGVSFKEVHEVFCWDVTRSF
jgi:hypothetical protein